MANSTNKLVLLLSSRFVLFLLFQALIGAGLASWEESQKYWILAATLTNVVSIILLIRLSTRECNTFFSMFRFTKAKWKGDLAICLGVALLSLPLIIIPSFALSNWLWGDPEYYHKVLFHTIPSPLIYLLLATYPVTIALAEIPTYFGYVMHRRKQNSGRQAFALALPVLFFSLQYCTLPLVPDAKFILFRGLMYLPFVATFGTLVFMRPSLVPWLSILDGLLNSLPLITLLSMSGEG